MSNFARCVAAALTIAPGALIAQRALSGRARINLPCADQNKLAQADVFLLLVKVRPASKGIVRRLRGVTFSVPGYATDSPGVCGRDLMTLWCAPKAGAARNSNQVPHPYRIALESSFRLNRYPTEMPATKDVAGPSPDFVRLAEDESAHWIGAASAQQAVQATVILSLAKIAVAQGRAHVGSCDGSPTGAGCDVGLARLDPADLTDVVVNGSSDGRLRLELQFHGDMAATITARLDEARFLPVAIEAVSFAFYIAVTSSAARLRDT